MTHPNPKLALPQWREWSIDAATWRTARTLEMSSYGLEHEYGGKQEVRSAATDAGRWGAMNAHLSRGVARAAISFEYASYASIVTIDAEWDHRSGLSLTCMDHPHVEDEAWDEIEASGLLDGLPPSGRFDLLSSMRIIECLIPDDAACDHWSVQKELGRSTCRRCDRVECECDPPREVEPDQRGMGLG